MDKRATEETDDLALPQPFSAWFTARGWAPRPHQLALIDKTGRGESALLIAPTGAGKTLAGFLPSMIALNGRGRIKPGSGFRGIHTLYVSPLKALAVDIERNLERPVTEMGLNLSIETRTGDTPQHKRARQRPRPNRWHC
jgi:ATP-dependent Lhr-like helicase